MGNASLGTKQQCGDCGCRFYDLNKKPITCPKCGWTLKVKKAKAVPIEVKDDDVKPTVDAETGVDLSSFNDEVDVVADMPGNIDTMESFDDDDNEIESLSELEGREIHEQQVGHDDTVEEEELIENMKDGGLIVDTIAEEGARA